MSQVFKLYRLQQLDSQIDQAKIRLEEIQKHLSQNTELKNAQDRADTAEKEIQVANRSLRRAEDEVKAQRIKIEQTEAILYGGKVRNPKELQDLQNEAFSLKKFLAVLEDRQLECMIQVEEIDSDHQKATEALLALKLQTEKEYSMLTTEAKLISKDLERLHAERSVAVAGIEDSDIKLYETLRIQRRGIAVAKVTDNTCAACGSTLTPALIQAAQLPNQIIRCTFCGRILYAG
jgi:predicted  nucleic acid-binding Zn-ribbon protein